MRLASSKYRSNRPHLVSPRDRNACAFVQGLPRPANAAVIRGRVQLSGSIEPVAPCPSGCCRLTAQPTRTRAQALCFAEVTARAPVAADVRAHANAEHSADSTERSTARRLAESQCQVQLEACGSRCGWGCNRWRHRASAERLGLVVVGSSGRSVRWLPYSAII